MTLLNTRSTVLVKLKSTIFLLIITYFVKGKKILSATQIEDGGVYVAAGNEKFKPMAYGTR